MTPGRRLHGVGAAPYLIPLFLYPSILHANWMNGRHGHSATRQYAAIHRECELRWYLEETYHAPSSLRFIVYRIVIDSGRLPATDT